MGNMNNLLTTCKPLYFHPGYIKKNVYLYPPHTTKTLSLVTEITQLALKVPCKIVAHNTLKFFLLSFFREKKNDTIQVKNSLIFAEDKKLGCRL